MVGGAQKSCHRMIENEKRESWFMQRRTVIESEMALL